jgi:hypothetical protein
MFYLFSSDATARYKRNVLDILCYPEGHIFTFRYQDRYVSDTIISWTSGQLPNWWDKVRGWLTRQSPLSLRLEKAISEKLNEAGRRGVTIYAETKEPPPHKRFNFFPVREIEIIRIKVEGSIYYVDFRLGKFINYYAGLNSQTIGVENDRYQKAAENKDEFQKQLEATAYHPLPPLTINQSQQKYGKTWDKSTGLMGDYTSALTNTTQGHFFSFVPNQAQDKTKHLAIQYLTGQSCSPPLTDEFVPNQSWESIADLLSKSSSMNYSIFYLVMGFFILQRRWGRGTKYRERLLPPVNDGWSTRYPLPMGKNVILKLLFYRSEEAPQIPTQKLDIKTEGEAFAGFSEKQILMLSNYNEERIQIACKRVFDSTLAPISIQRIPDTTFAEDSKILAPHPFLLTQVAVPRRTVFFIIVALVVAPLLLALSPDYLKHIGGGQIMQGYAPSIGKWIERNAGDLSTYAKAVAASFTLIAGYLGFRRLPIGK